MYQISHPSKQILNILILFLSLYSAYSTESIPLPKEILNFPLPARVVTAIILIPSGLALCFAGRKLSKFVLFIAGAALAWFVTFTIIRSIVDLETATYNAKLGAYVGSGIAAFIGGCLSFSFLRFGIFLLGGYLGFGLATITIRVGTIQSNTTQMILTISFVVIMAIIAYIYSEIVLIYATAISGSSLFHHGIDMFAHTGFNDFLFKLNANTHLSPNTYKIWIMICSFIIISFIGAHLQFRTYRK